MIRLSTKGRYGVRLMLDLALHQGDRPVLLREIAKRQDISEKYLWQMIAPLRNAGLIQSTRGIKGGYQLLKDPGDVTLKHIITILEGEISLVDCVQKTGDCSRESVCAAQSLWSEINGKIAAIFEGYTLKDIIDKHCVTKETLAYVI